MSDLRGRTMSDFSVCIASLSDDRYTAALAWNDRVWSLDCGHLHHRPDLAWRCEATVTRRFQTMLDCHTAEWTVGRAGSGQPMVIVHYKTPDGTKIESRFHALNSEERQ